MNILQVLDRPIAFHRVFVRITGGSINAALMLSQCVYWSQRSTLGEGWFYKTVAEWEDETGLSRRELDTARKILRELNVIKEERRGNPGKIHYQVQAEALHDLCMEGRKVCTEQPVESGGKRQSLYTETTQRLLTTPPEDGEDDPSAKNKEQRAAVRRVFAHYLQVTGRNPKLYELTEKRMKVGLARLEDVRRKFNVVLAKCEEVLMIAVDNLAESKFHMGDNEHKRQYIDWIDNLFKSTEKLEWWLDR